MIAPGAVVADINTLLAFGVGPNEGAIGVEDRFLEELGGLLGPDPQPGLIDGVHQRSRTWGSEKRRQKSPAVVGSGIRSAPKALR